MNIHFSAHPEADPSPLRDLLTSAGHTLSDFPAGPAAPLSGALWLVCPPSDPASATTYLSALAPLTGPDSLLVACGPFTSPDSVSSLLAAGAADVILTPCQTQPLEARLRVLAHRLHLQSRPALDAALAARLARAQHLESLSSLAHSIAHDYNNLLAAIQGNTELALLDPSTPEPIQYSLKQIDSAARRAAALTSQILAYAEPLSPLHDPRLRFSLSHLVRDNSNLLRAALPRRIRLEFHLGRMLPFVESDPRLLRQLLLGLTLASAARAAHRAGVVKLLTAAADGQVSLIIEDDVPTSIQPDPALASLAASLGTSLEACPSSLGGAALRLSLPSVAQPATPDPAPASLGESTATILLIDDDEAVRFATRRLLRKAGFTILEAADGSEGLALFQQVGSALDAVLLDLNMPGMHPRDIVAALRHQRPDLRIIVWTGYDEAYARQQMPGLDDLLFMEKPTDLSLLPGLLRQALA